MHKIAIVIPVYKKDLDKDEELSLSYVKKNAKRYPKIIISPKGLKFNFDSEGFQRVDFDAKNFTSIKSYSDMMMSKFFYKKFVKFDYILIAQLDSLLLGNKIQEWADKNFSYIGAPFFRKNKTIKGYGNGGFSLRKVDDCLRVLSSDRLFLKKLTFNLFYQYLKWQYFKNWLRYFFKFSKLNGATKFISFFDRWEDEFWSFYAPLFDRKYTLPQGNEGLGFSSDTKPELVYKLNKGLPLGIHAWAKKDREFYINKISKL